MLVVLVTFYIVIYLRPAPILIFKGVIVIYLISHKVVKLIGNTKELSNFGRLMISGQRGIKCLTISNMTVGQTTGP